MGTYAGIFKESGSIIPESIRKEFTERIEALYQAGGMMEVEWVQLHGKKVAMIRKAEMNKDGMDFYYNYFEDDCWENAGFNNENCCVWSNKIGWRHFHMVVVAAYVLEELYTEGVSAAMVDGVPVTSWGYVGWINYLFHEKFHVKNFDPWKLFEAFHYWEEDQSSYIDWYDFGCKRYAFIGGCEIYAVLNGTQKALEVFGDKDKEELENLAMDGMKSAIEALKQYEKSNKADKESQLQKLMDMIRGYYEKSDRNIGSLKFDDESLKSVCKYLRISDSPAFIVKAISEIYNKDFWDLWTELRNVVKRKFVSLYGNDDYYISPVSTADFLGQSPDDMIPFWKENCDFEFSKELWEWFKDLKNKFDSIVNTDFEIKKPLKYILDLMEEADENYYRIYTFADFFEETLENLGDKRYQTLWKLYDDMLHDPELKNAGDVIFVPEGPEYEHMGLHYWGEPPKRRLMHNWDIMDLDKRNNKARVTFRRYMALVANRELRCKVFGF